MHHDIIKDAFAAAVQLHRAGHWVWWQLRIDVCYRLRQKHSCLPELGPDSDAKENCHAAFF
jgi:hypothetical protein